MSRSRRRGLRITVLTAALTLAIAPAALANICNSIPSIPLVPNPAKTVCNTAGGAINAAGDLVGGHPGKAITDVIAAPLQGLSDGIMQGVTSWVGKGAAWLVGQAGKLISETTTPRLESDWFAQQYSSMGGLAALFALPLLLAAVLQGVMRRDGAIVVRAAFFYLPLAFLLTAMAVTVVALLLQLTDELCSQVSGSVGNDANAFFSDVAKGLDSLMGSTGGGAVPLFAVFLGGLIAAVGAFFVWVELLIRSAGIYVAVLFLPFTFVAMIWPATARWCRRLLEMLFAIIFSKFVIVAIMSLAAAGLGQSRGADAFQGVLAGAALMILAAFSPLVLLRLVPIVEAAAHTSGRGGAGSQALGPIAGPAAVMRRVTDANWGGSMAGGLRAAPAGAGFAAGGAQAMTAGMRSATTNATGVTTQSSANSAGTPDDARYATAAGSGQAARPAPAGTPGASPATPATAAPGAAATPASSDATPALAAPRAPERPPMPPVPSQRPARPADRKGGGSAR